MIEIRPICSGEAPTFLRLLCQAFDLDYGRAHSVFFTEPYFDLRRKWGLFENRTLQTILTLTPLEFGWGKSVGIAGVATRPQSRGKGLATRLIQEALDYAGRHGEHSAMLFAHNASIYKRAGFQILDHVVKGLVESRPRHDVADNLSVDEVQRMYDLWCYKDPSRLRRDARRWQFWRWSLRCCEPFGEGYLCTEAAVVREAVLAKAEPFWPVPAGTEWVGTRKVTREMHVPVRDEREELLLMGRNCPEIPAMFMTDQF